MKNIISRISAIALVVSVAGAGFAQQTFSFAGPIDSTPVTGTPTQFLAQNPVGTAYLVGSNVELISGDLTAVNAATWASEARIQLKNSAFPALTLIVQPFTSNEITGTISITPGTITATGGLAGTGTLVPAASTWDVLFYDSFDDGADTLVDSQWTGTVSFSTTVGTIPPPSPYIYDNTVTAGTQYLNQRNPAGFGLGVASLGDQLVLAGTNRKVTELAVVYFASATTPVTTADFEVKIFTGVGPFTTASPVQTAVYNDVPITSGALVTYGFGGLSAELGAGATEMAYTIKLSDIQGGAGGLGPVLFDPPQVGSSANFFLSDSDGAATVPVLVLWEFTGGVPVANFGARVTATSAAKISGAIDLLSTVGSGGTEDITWTLESGANSYTGTVTVADVSSSNYEINIPAGAPNGTYILKFKGGTFLSDSLEVTLTGASLTGQNVALVNGDIDQDTEVGPGDFEAVVSLFGGPGDADCDNDGEVGPGDFEIVVANFGLGDQ